MREGERDEEANQRRGTAWGPWPFTPLLAMSPQEGPPRGVLLAGTGEGAHLVLGHRGANVTLPGRALAGRAGTSSTPCPCTSPSPRFFFS